MSVCWFNRCSEDKVNVWLINTGWIGGPCGQGERIKLNYSRVIIDAIHSVELASAEYTNLHVFNLAIPRRCSDVLDNILMPKRSWTHRVQYNEALSRLADMFNEIFNQYKEALNRLADMFNEIFNQYKGRHMDKVKKASPVY